LSLPISLPALTVNDINRSISKEEAMPKQLVFSILMLTLILAACQTAASLPTSTPLPMPTQTEVVTTTVIPSPTPVWGLGEFVIQVKSRAMIVEVNGHGPTAIIMANTMAGSPYSWHLLVEALDPETYTMVNFKYTVKDVISSRRDVTELADYLEGMGYKKIICAGGSMGAQACGVMAKRPTTVGLVLLAGFKGAAYDEVIVPKLFIAAENDFKQEMETQYRAAAEPKAIHIFPGGAHATDLFDTTSGDEVIKLIEDFLAQIP
jgi:hypothetical protein